MFTLHQTYCDKYERTKPRVEDFMSKPANRSGWLSTDAGIVGYHIGLLTATAAERTLYAWSLQQELSSTAT